MQTTTIVHAKLRLSDRNVRKANSDTGLKALAASIAEHGLLQPLIVSPAAGRKALYDVHAGGRRWRAIGMLIEHGTLPRDHGIEVRLCENEDTVAREISLAENLIREAMAPADEASAYNDIIAGGADAEAVARRFGVTVRHVHGRLRIANLAEPIFAALAAGEITLDVAMAYGSTGDRERQRAVWERLSSSWQSENPHAIRRAIADDGIASDHPVARFLGEEEYVACGGRIERDLFAADSAGQWLDGDLAMDLATRKLAHEAEIAELGCKLAWVTPILATHVSHDDTRDLHPYRPCRAEPAPEAQIRMADVSSRMAEIAERLDGGDDGDDTEALEAEYHALEAEHDRLADTEQVIPEEDRLNVGTFLVLGKDGQPHLLETYYTSVKPSRRSRSATEAADGLNPDGGEPVPSLGLPRSLEEQLAKDRRDVLALHIAQDPALALDLAMFSLAREHAGHFGAHDTGCTIRTTDLHEPSGLTGIPASSAATELECRRASLPDDWANDGDSFASFLAFRAMSDTVKAGWLAYAVSQSLKANLASGTRACAFLNRLGADIGIDMAQHWRPGAETFFDRVKKAQILGILGEFDPDIALRYAAGKKSELAAVVARLCAGEAIVEPAIKARALAWVPDVMRFDAVAVDPQHVAIAPADVVDKVLDVGDDRADHDDVQQPLPEAV